MKKNLLFVGFLSTIFLSTFIGETCLAGKQPTVLLTPEVLEITREANEKIASIDRSLSGTFKKIDKTRKLFEKSKCTPESTDQGCMKIKEQMQEAYLKMLDQFMEVIPEIEKSFDRASEKLGQRIKSQIGRKLSPKDLMEKLANEGSGPRITINRRNSLAARTAKYLKLLTSKKIRSPEVMASEIYIDQKDALYNLSLLSQQVAYQKQMLQTEISMGGYSQESIDNAQLVRDAVFGGEDTEDPYAEPPTTSGGSDTETGGVLDDLDG